ncbi:GNAT family N-acetyltransferase [Streptomyces sp. enrichment culture]|uniref:GNAT family N-acetyltransferase n=1 Tax=Streptomyces sp. enrichment culture TaxID=1795815 RepID=UPI003F554908
MEFTMGGRLEVRITPDDVGKRVSVRTIAAQGDGTARFTDTVGVLTSWTGGVLSITRRNGEMIRHEEATVVAGKTVPAAPARRRGTPAAGVAELVAVAGRGWPGVETERVGDWRLNAAAGWTARANSAYRVGPGAPEVDRIREWYAARGLPARLQVTTGAGDSDELLDAALERAGWRAERFALLRVAPLAPLADREPDPRVRVHRELSDAWLAGYPRHREAPDTVREVLTGGPSVWFATVPGAAVARCVVDGRWAGFAAVEVAAAHRRRGLATALMAELARTALAEGASAAYLQVETGNSAARAVYDRLGFTDHHHYHYRTAP